MHRGPDVVAKHEAFHQDARASFERAADGPQKDAAGLYLRLADTARMNGNEVDFLLSIWRAIRALV